MKLTAFLLLIVCLHVSATGFSQKIILSMKDAPLSTVFNRIEQQSGYKFFYDNKLVKKASHVTVEFQGTSIRDIMDEVIKNQGLIYNIVNKTIVIRKKEELRKAAPVGLTPEQLIPKSLTFGISPPEISKRLSELLAGGPVLSNVEIAIRGKVIDDRGEGLPGVSILVRGTQRGTVTNAQGDFDLAVPDGKAVLVFSFVGFLSQEIAVGSRSVFEVSLKVDEKNLEEVVVIGYGTVNRRDLTGAVSSVGAKQLKNIPLNSAAEALTGRLAGVQVTTSEGAPGAPIQIRVRGGGSITQDNSPLYVIDGVQVENGLASLSPQDIESIDVLKDASATAIYGARGANGVIVVTTKGGREMKTTVNYNGFVGFRQLANKLKVMDPYDFVNYQYERTRDSYGDSVSFVSLFGRTFDTLAVYKDTKKVDWQDEVFGRNAFMQTHNFSVTGGSKTTTYNLSLTKNFEQGVMRVSDFDRNLVNFRFDHTVSSKLKVAFNMRYTNQLVTGSGTSAPGLSNNSRLRHTIKYTPYIVDPNRSVSDFDQAYFDQTNLSGNALAIFNPVFLNENEYRKNKTSTLNLSGYINYNLAKYLSFRSTIGINQNHNQADSFDGSQTPAAIYSWGGKPFVSITTNDQNSLNFSNVLNFSNGSLKSNGGLHTLDALLGQEIYQVTSGTFINQVRDFPTVITPQKAISVLSLGNSVPLYPSTTYLDSKLLSFFSRVNYSFKSKYLATVTLRADGSSKFSKGKRWGYFPSAALAWRISEEEFIKQQNVVSNVKLRLSYGLAGNNRINDFLYMTLYGVNSAYGLGDVVTPGYGVSKLANTNLKWETVLSRNIGLDFGLWHDRLQFTFDAYQNDTRDLLLGVPIPTSSGYTTQQQNVGSTRNTGLELQVNGTLVRKADFQWSVNFNVAHNTNVIRSLSNFQNSYFQSSNWGLSSQLPDYIVQVGQPVGAMYGFVTDGFYKVDDFNYNADTKVYSLKEGVPNNSGLVGIVSPGTLKFKDLNGDGIVNADKDRKIIGTAVPKLTGGINQQLAYKNFDLSIFLNFVLGNKIMNANKVEFTSGYNINTNLLDMMNDRWRTVDENGNILQRISTVAGKQVITGVPPEQLAARNKNATIWQPLRGTGSFLLHSWAIEDGSFLRVNNISLGYSIPQKLLKLIKVSSLRFYVTVNNLKVFTKYSGYDPEVSTRSYIPVTPGVDYSAYPRSKAYIFGVNLNF